MCPMIIWQKKSENERETVIILIFNRRKKKVEKWKRIYEQQHKKESTHILKQ